MLQLPLLFLSVVQPLDHSKFFTTHLENHQSSLILISVRLQELLTSGGRSRLHYCCEIIIPHSCGRLPRCVHLGILLSEEYGCRFFTSALASDEEPVDRAPCNLLQGALKTCLIGHGTVTKDYHVSLLQNQVCRTFIT